MAKWTVSEETDQLGRKCRTVQQGRKKVAVKLTEGDADQLVRYILRKFDN